MTLHIDITYQAQQWQKTLTPSIEQACREVFAHFEDSNGEVSVVLADNDFVQKLSNQWRGKDQPTNVLSFATNDNAELEGMVASLGDIVIAYETVVAEAKHQHKPFENHLTHLVIHGMLHLLGLDHINNDEAEEMESLEIQILQSLNIDNPYCGSDVI